MLSNTLLERKRITDRQMDSGESSYNRSGGATIGVRKPITVVITAITGPLSSVGEQNEVCGNEI